MVTFQELAETEKIQELMEDDHDDQFTDEPPSSPLLHASNPSHQNITEVDQDDENDEDEDVFDESWLERIGALVDIIPPTTRVHFQTTLSHSLHFALGLGKTFGSGLWMLATGSLLVFLPVSLELERDAMTIQEAQQMRSSSGSTATTSA